MLRRNRPGIPRLTGIVRDWRVAGPPTGGWGIGGTALRSVHDADLGTLLFPAHDEVMVPWIAEYGTWEPLERAWLEKTLRPGNVFLNVGANVGYHTLLASRLVGPEGRVIAVEPDPINFQFLLTNLALHDVQNVTPIQCAAGSAATTLQLHRGDSNAGDNRLTPFAGSTSSVRVRVQRLDKLLAGLSIDVVLMDTQGWDHEVVAGMSGLLVDGRPPMIVELVPSWLRERGIDPVAVVEGLQELGYHIGVLEAGLAPGAPAAEVIAACDNDRWWFANLELQPRA